MKALLGLLLKGRGQFVEHVGRFVNPAALHGQVRVDEGQGRQKSFASVAHHEFDLPAVKAPPAEIVKQNLPGGLGFSESCLIKGCASDIVESGFIGASSRLGVSNTQTRRE